MLYIYWARMVSENELIDHFRNISTSTLTIYHLFIKNYVAFMLCMVNVLFKTLDRKLLQQMLLKYLECFAGGQLWEEAQFVVPQVQLLERRHLCQNRRHAL